MDYCLCLTARRAARTLTRLYDEALRPSGLTATQFGMLSLLDARPGMTQAQLATRVDSDQTTLSRGLRLMVANRWVRAKQDAEDARRVTYELTREGAQRRAEAMPLWESAQDAMKQRLGKRFRKTIGMLQKVSAA